GRAGRRPVRATALWPTRPDPNERRQQPAARRPGSLVSLPPFNGAGARSPLRRLVLIVTLARLVKMDDVRVLFEVDQLSVAPPGNSRREALRGLTVRQ